MKIAYYYPPQTIVQKDIAWLKYIPGVEFMHNNCDKSCDMIYVSTLGALDKAMVAKNRFNKPIVCWVWDLPFNSQTDWDLDRAGIQENAGRPGDCNRKASLLRQCDLLISSSKWVQQTLKEHFNLDSEQMYFFIDTEQLDSVPAQKTEKRIIQISRFGWNKKWENTLHATKDLDYETAFVGIKNSIHYFGMINDLKNPNTHFYINAHRNEVIRLLKTSSILVSPSVFEGWGISPIEALHCDVPVLLSDLPVFQEVYEDAIIYHDRFSKDDMKAKLERLTIDVELQKRIVEQGKLKIKDFTPQVFASNFNKIISR